MKQLIIGDGPAVQKKCESLGIVGPYIDLRGPYHDVANVMDLYESVKPELISEVRSTIISENPDVIIVVGKLEGYLWLGTIITRFFGQFNSWNDQRENSYGITTIQVDGKPVRLYAVACLEDYLELIKV